eukprot:3249407-Prymnesium_polylepis.1
MLRAQEPGSYLHPGLCLQGRPTTPTAHPRKPPLVLVTSSPCGELLSHLYFQLLRRQAGVTLQRYYCYRRGSLKNRDHLLAGRAAAPSCE